MRTWQRRMAAVTLAAALVGGMALVAAQQKPAPAPVKGTTADGLLGTAQYQEQVEGKLDLAIASYKKVLAAPDATSSQKARAQLHIGLCYERLGFAEARKAYEAVISNYAEQREFAQQAKAGLSRLPWASVAPSGQLSRRRVLAGVTRPSRELHRLSPDGRFVSGRDIVTGGLVVRTIGDGTTRVLLSPTSGREGREYADESVWSPDGHRIACLWYISDRDKYELRIVTVADGKWQTLPVQREGYYALDDWAPDGSRLLVDFLGDTGPGFDLAWLSLRDGSVDVLATVRNSVLVVSPDGSSIAYAEGGLSDRDIVLFDTATRTRRTVVAQRSDESVVAWTPAGDLLFRSNRSGRYAYWLLHLKAGEAEGEPEFVCDSLGDTVRAFGVSRTGALLYESETTAREIFVHDLDWTSGKLVGEARRLNLDGLRQNDSPQWSPDGRMLAWASGVEEGNVRQGMGLLSVWVPETGQTRHVSLPAPAGVATTIRWTPDGESIIYRSYGDKGSGLFHVNVRTGLSRVVVEPGQPGGSSWSPDGSRLYYVTPTIPQPTADGTQRLVERDIATGEERELARTGTERLGSPEPSPDGRWVAFTTWPRDAATGSPVQRKVQLVSRPNGERRTACDVTGMGASATWLPDSRTLLLAVRQPGESGDASDSTFDFLTCSVEGGLARKLAVSVGAVSRPQWSVQPGNARVAYAQSTRRSNGVWLMENFLPPPKPTKK